MVSLAVFVALQYAVFFYVLPHGASMASVEPKMYHQVSWTELTSQVRTGERLAFLRLVPLIVKICLCHSLSLGDPHSCQLLSVSGCMGV